MIILGIHDGHNASAALLVDGRPRAVISEERLTYRKNEMGFPALAVAECLRMAGVRGNEVDIVAFSSMSLPLHYLRTKREFSFTIRDWLDEQEHYWKPKIFEGRLNRQYFEQLFAQPRFREKQAYSFEGIPETLLSPEEDERHLQRIRREAVERYLGVDASRILRFDHHTCHAHYAYFASPFRGRSALVFTADGGGDGTNATLWIAENDRLREVERNNCTDLARIYRYITLILGMKIGEHEYKVMGLAPYASEYEVRRCEPVFSGLFHVPDVMVEYARRPRDLFFHFREALADCRFDGIAGAVQQLVESVGTEWFSKATTKLGISRVVFSGGLSMNVKLNQRIAELLSVDEFYCPASGGDESLAVGACYVAHVQAGAEGVPTDLRNNYLGPSPSREDILHSVRTLRKVTVREHVTSDEVAEILATGRILGRMAGRMEFGARSLGNRSILADPSSRDVIERINQQIKRRDFWMPFAPSVLEEYAARYLVGRASMLGDHMTHTFHCTPEGRRALVAGIHPADGTARAHVVTREINPGYHDLIERFSRITGVGALLNTSFNLHGKPVVCAPHHAVHVFENSALDGMILEDVLVLRDGTPA